MGWSDGDDSYYHVPNTNEGWGGGVEQSREEEEFGNWGDIMERKRSRKGRGHLYTTI